MRTHVYHVGAWGRNYGDRAIQLATMQQLAQHLPGLVEWHHHDLQERIFDEAWVEEVNAQGTLVVVGPGGLLWDKPGLNSPTGWQWRIPGRLVAQLQPPLVLHTLGWTRFPYNDPTGTHPELVPHLATCFEQAAHKAVRNRGTLQALHQLGLRIAPQVLPDVAITTPAEAVHLPAGLFPGPVIGLCWASDKPGWRWAGGAAEEERWLLQVLVPVLCNAIQQHGATVLLVPHIAGLDKGIRDQLEAHLPAGRFVCAEQDGMLPYPATLAGTPTLAGIYQQCTMVLSMRKHGLWIPFGQGVPVVGLGDLPEVAWTMRSLGMPDMLATSSCTERRLQRLVNIWMDAPANAAWRAQSQPRTMRRALAKLGKWHASIGRTVKAYRAGERS